MSDNLDLMYRFVGLWGGLLVGTGAQAQQVVPALGPVRFKAPVEVFFRLHQPVPGAEYRLIMDAPLVACLDTLSFSAMLHQPGIYFAKLFPEAVPASPHPKYYKTAPVTQGEGAYPFTEQQVNVAYLARPLKGLFYTQKEAATSYRGGLARKNAADFGPLRPPDTLPGVDSVRVVYVLTERAHWKRGFNRRAVK